MPDDAQNVNQNAEQNVSVENEEKQTFTLEEVQKLLNAKNYEKEQRKNLSAENKTLKEEIAKLKGDESIEKFKDDELASLKQQLMDLQNEKENLLQMQAQNELKDALRTFKGILPEAIDDVLEKALKAGFKKTELGYLDTNGKTLENFFEGLKSSHSYYFGISSNKNVIPDALQKQIDNAKKTGNTLGMLQEAFKQINLKELK
jgi:hypothetical protein